MDWNKTVPDMAGKVEESNREILANVEAGNLEPEAVIDLWMPTPKELPLPKRQWAHWFLQQYGWSFLSRSSDTQSWLPFNHPDMKMTRQRLVDLISSGKVSGSLILNFDQVWRSCYQFGGKLLYKDRTKVRQRSKRSKAPKRSDKKLHTVKGGRRGITDSWIQCSSFLSYTYTIANTNIY